MQTSQYADLEIGLYHRYTGRYQVEFRFSRPDSDTDDRLTQAGEALAVHFDMDGLLDWARRTISII